MPGLSAAHTRTWTSRVVSSTSPQSGQLARIVAIARSPVRFGLPSAGEPSAGVGGALSEWGENGPYGPSPPRSSRCPIGFAHRGARAHAPENTLEAFRLALARRHRARERRVAHRRRRGRARPRRRRRGLAAPAADRHRAAPPAAGHIPTLEELYATVGTDFDLSPRRQGPGRRRRRASPPPTPGRRRDRLWLCHPTRELVADVAGADRRTSASSTPPGSGA